MGSIRSRSETGALFMDFKFGGKRVREQTTLPDTPSNRKRLQKALDRIEGEIALGNFDYAKTFGKPMPQGKEDAKEVQTAGAISSTPSKTPLFKDFAETWFNEAAVSWRKSYRITQSGALEKYINPYFGEKVVGSITKADVLDFRATLTKVTTRKSQSTLSNRRINAVMKPLRQILNEAADRFEFNSSFRHIKPLKMKRSDVFPFSLEEVQRILVNCRSDYRSYFTVRFFTGMRTGEVHGLKWKYIDWERRLILVREAIVLNDEDELKTDGSLRDIQMSQLVVDALKSQFEVTGKTSEYVFCNRTCQPVDNQNFLNRIWAPLLRNLGLAHRRAYQTRHTAATLWLASGEAPEWIARQLGHTTTEMLFRVYSRYVPNLTRRDGSAMERMLGQHISIAPVSATVQRVDVSEGVKDSSDIPTPKPVFPSTEKPRKQQGNAKSNVDVIDAVAKRVDDNLSQRIRQNKGPADAQPPPLGWTELARSWQSSLASSPAY
jgi:integrase